MYMLTAAISASTLSTINDDNLQTTKTPTSFIIKHKQTIMNK